MFSIRDDIMFFLSNILNGFLLWAITKFPKRFKFTILPEAIINACSNTIFNTAITLDRFSLFGEKVLTLHGTYSDLYNFRVNIKNKAEIEFEWWLNDSPTHIKCVHFLGERATADYVVEALQHEGHYIKAMTRVERYKANYGAIIKYIDYSAHEKYITVHYLLGREIRTISAYYLNNDLKKKLKGALMNFQDIVQHQLIGHINTILSRYTNLDIQATMNAESSSVMFSVYGYPIFKYDLLQTMDKQIGGLYDAVFELVMDKGICLVKLGSEKEFSLAHSDFGSGRFMHIKYVTSNTNGDTEVFASDAVIRHITNRVSLELL